MCLVQLLPLLPKTHLPSILAISRMMLFTESGINSSKAAFMSVTWLTAIIVGPGTFFRFSANSYVWLFFGDQNQFVSFLAWCNWNNKSLVWFKIRIPRNRIKTKIVVYILYFNVMINDDFQSFLNCHPFASAAHFIKVTTSALLHVCACMCVHERDWGQMCIAVTKK